MESEKVKEIKKLIRYLADTYGTSKCLGKPNRKLFADILTLINELEEENERLREENYIIKGNPPIIADRSIGKTIRAKLIDYDKLKQFNKSLKDRIAELENKTELNKSMEIQQALNKGKQETAKEILNMGKKLYEMSYHKSNAMPRLIEWIKVEYGVEIEE